MSEFSATASSSAIVKPFQLSLEDAKEWIARLLEENGELHSRLHEDRAKKFGATASAGETRKYSLLTDKGALMPHSSSAAILAGMLDKLRYDQVTARWMSYTGSCWCEITESAALRTIKEMLDGGLKGKGYPIAYLNGVAAFLRILLAIEGFDSNPSLVPFTNGVFDLSAGYLIPHSTQLKISWCLPYAYDSRATCQPVIDWLSESVGGDPLQVELLRAFLKAVITARPDFQRYLELIGGGGTGKGTYIRLCTAIVGPRNVHVTELKHLENNRFETARLYKKRLCVVTDAEKYSGDMSILKAMTGQDDLRFEEKHRQGGESFRFNGMVLLSSNEHISSRDHTSGLQRRRITVRFNNQVSPTNRRDLEAEFKPCLPGVITWALAMPDSRMKELLVDTDRAVPEVRDSNRETLTKTNPIAAWLDTCIVLDSTAETCVGIAKKCVVHTASDTQAKESRTVFENTDTWLYANFAQWCQDTNQQATGLKKFSSRLYDLLRNQLKLDGIKHLPRSGNRHSRFTGIRVRTDADGDSPSPVFFDGKCDEVRQEYGKSTARDRGNTNKPTNVENINVEISAGNGGTTEMLQQTKRDFSGFAVLVSENAASSRTVAVPLPYQDRITCTQCKAYPAGGWKHCFLVQKLVTDPDSPPCEGEKFQARD